MHHCMTLLLVLVKVLTFSVWMFECTIFIKLYAFVALKNHMYLVCLVHARIFGNVGNWFLASLLL